MIFLKCCITFSDGKILWGEMQAASANRKYRIEYTGPSDRLGEMPNTATPAGLELLFATAIYNGAVGGGVRAEGQYGYGPKYVADVRLLEAQRHRERYLKS